MKQKKRQKLKQQQQQQLAAVASTLSESSSTVVPLPLDRLRSVASSTLVSDGRTSPVVVRSSLDHAQLTLIRQRHDAPRISVT